MHFLRRLGIDTYMLLLIGMVILGVIIPAQGFAAATLKQVTYWAVSLLFLLYGLKLDPSSVRAGFLNWRLQGLTLIATYAMFPILGLGFAQVFGPLLGAQVTLGVLFLAVLPSTVQSSIAFTSIAGGNVPGAICAASASNLLGVALTPALVAVMLQTGGGEVRLDAVLRIGTQILLPFILGQVLRPWLGAFIARHKKVTLYVDRGSILLIVYSAFSAGTRTGLWDTVPLPKLFTLWVVILIFLAISMGLMIAAGRGFRMDYPDRAALFYCGSTKSIATGIPIASALFPAAEVGAIVLPAMMYHITQLLICAFVSQRAQRNASM
ncbi:sodium/bile acid cotransporter 7 [Rhodobacter aestuarii]|uniref:Solute carrier family 10 (Sodium/bile acid cotransporter), member 7 n=1 Tax=Rhodobacter aestuarii TaxID=453582 RepID=A0A1N7KAE9_9RHOB|nr:MULTISPECIES: bile acid:sodium symporter family protein [Rhodobacter]PTV95786.1 sodium/bile acid cotransporter 7 [Rhodobacter aestuarii]SIS58571.1 solute carrier family 10 (sodium/bile acid cotransporter), member 7 [Rhodobacter aestuarii]SOC17261.1 sodium/bile acid cotransporter 7 [Rhodobacter sp. JA431]